MKRNTFDASPESAMSFLVSQRTHIEPKVYETKYPDVTYSELIPVDSSAPEWAPIVAVASVDARGELAFVGPNSNDINRADVGYKLGTHPVQTAALGYGFSLEEINQARMLNINLSADKAKASMRIAEQGLNKLAYVGNKEAGYGGLFNMPGIGVTAAGSTIAALVAGATDVAGAQAVVTFFQQAIDEVYLTNTNTTFAPTHILLPPAQRNLLSSAILPFGGNMTLLQYLEMNLVSGRNGKVKFTPELSLKGAGAGGTDRMMVYTKSEETAKFHLPMGFRFQSPYQDSALSWFIPGILRTGGTEVRIPKAHQYRDGV
ncbi:MAG: DUF2184 domain-containing protein [Paenalcaligenes sp.]